ncbi:MAG: GNAT family N-acetyltransferase [Candidatus Tyrphobacter sp.]
MESEEPHVVTCAQRLSAATVSQAVAYLDRSPYENVFLTYIALEGGPLQRDVRIVRDGDDRVCGVGFFGRHVVLAGEDAALPALAEAAAGLNENAVVGPQRTVNTYWQLIRSQHAPARLVRERQPVMAVDAQSLRGANGAVSVRRARESEWAVIAENSAAMISGEIEADARLEMPQFGAGIRHMIRLGLWWVGECREGLCFFCNVGAWSPQTAQLQGIWTPPRFRRRGIATAALGAICRTLLCMVPSLSLYVNDFNAPAIALYRGIGFREVGALQTIFF